LSGRRAREHELRPKSDPVGAPSSKDLSAGLSGGGPIPNLIEAPANGGFPSISAMGHNGSLAPRSEHALARLRQLGGSLYGISGPLVFAAPFVGQLILPTLVNNFPYLKHWLPQRCVATPSDVTERDTRLGPNRSGAEFRHTSSVCYTNMTAVNTRFLSGRQNSATRQSCRGIHPNPHEIQMLSGDCYRTASPVPQANRGLTRELALNRRSSHLHCPPPH